MRVTCVVYITTITRLRTLRYEYYDKSEIITKKKNRLLLLFYTYKACGELNIRYTF